MFMQAACRFSRVLECGEESGSGRMWVVGKGSVRVCRKPGACATGKRRTSNKATEWHAGAARTVFVFYVNI